MAILPERRAATERIESKVRTLDFMKAHLIELSKMAAHGNHDMLCYLIEMAAAEADTTILAQEALLGTPKITNGSSAVKRSA